MLGNAKALAVDPQLLVMDEPSAELSPLFVKGVMRILADLQRRGLALLIAQQNIRFLDVATRVFVLEGERIRFSGTVAENDRQRRAAAGLFRSHVEAPKAWRTSAVHIGAGDHRAVTAGRTRRPRS
jgi:branched-chain amino acid transport system ATP-binding protein